MSDEMKEMSEQPRSLDRLVGLIDDIEGWVEWHADMDADIDDPSPYDMHAHCNGLIMQACAKAKEILANASGDSEPK
jgi:hypothetical protein